MRFAAKYEKKIEELTAQCQLKSDECYEAWMSLTAANKQIENVRAELDKRIFQNYYQGKEKKSMRLQWGFWILDREKQGWRGDSY